MNKLFVIFAAALCPAVVWAGTAGSCGGPGLGTTTKTLDCGSSGYVVGVQGWAGGYVENIRLICRKLVNGNLEQTTYLTAVAGRGNVNINYEGKVASANRAVNSFRMHCGTFVDRIDRIFFRTLIDGKLGYCDPDPDCHDYVNGGGTGGSETQMKCPIGELMYKAVVKSGMWIDNITLYCRKP